MKYTLILLGCMISLAASGQNSTDYYGEGRKVKTEKIRLSGVNEFDNMTMEYKDGTVLFNDIPEMPKAIAVSVTNAEGELLKERRISAGSNVLQLGKLDKGLYFVTVAYRNESKKAFVLKID